MKNDCLILIKDMVTKFIGHKTNATMKTETLLEQITELYY